MSSIPGMEPLTARGQPPNITALSERLCGTRFPGGTYTITTDIHSTVTALVEATDHPQTVHPALCIVTALNAIGLPLDQVCLLAEANINDGPLLGECDIRLHRPLQVDEPYSVSGQITGVTRKRSQRLGLKDLLAFTLNIASSEGKEVADVGLVWILPRPEPLQ